ncbi:ComGF family competence protein [Alkalicoccobacillus murimartini]|nr:ComGF family competence protein [Alkalicoccobacillus murimartini]
MMWSPFFGYYSKIELNIFSNQLAVDVREAEVMITEDKRVYLLKNDEEIRYELISGSIRRFVGNRGYVPMLDSVESFSCSELEGLLTCYTEMQNGLSNERVMSSMYQKMENL